jgi:hypothetical protein
MVEEGIRDLSPSSSEISFPESRQHTPKLRLTTLNATHNYVEAHHKSKANGAKDNNSSKHTALRTNRKEKMQA